MNDSTMKLLLDTGTLRKFSIKDTSLPVIFDKHYAPLEVYSTKGELGPWTDIYALCATIYLKGMSVDIKDRYQSMEEFCEASLYGAVNERLGF